MKVSGVNYLRKNAIEPYNSVLKICELRGEIAVIGHRGRKFTDLKFDVYPLNIELPDSIQLELDNACETYWKSKPVTERRNDGWLWGVGHAGLIRMPVLNDDVPRFVSEINRILEAYQPE